MAIQRELLRIPSELIRSGQSVQRAHSEQAVVGGIAPNQVIAGSEFEVHREIYTE